LPAAADVFVAGVARINEAHPAARSSPLLRGLRMAPSNRVAGWLIAGAVLVAMFGAAVFAFRHAGRWLIRESALSHADAILVLSGSMPYRAEEAAKVYQQGFAPEIWLTHPVSPSEELQSMGISYESDEDYDKGVFAHDGVPAGAVRVLPQEIVNTEEELEEAHAELAREGKSTILIVTSLPHTRRVAAIWRRLYGADSRAIVHGAPEDPFDADRWWGNTRDALSVTREYFGLLNAWTGLPVRPQK
jgi:uncharacterized SAM-binding protein YcdF (DUF218 family)